MGWEWHNRPRDSDGRFTGRREDADCQVHMRCSMRQREEIRNRAFARHMDITEYLLHLVEDDLRRRARTYE